MGPVHSKLNVEGALMTITHCVFDAYGTLFDVSAAATDLAQRPDRQDFARHAPTVSRDWRAKQLEYSWLRATAGAHIDFWTVTKDSLDWALEASSLDGDRALRADLLALYWQLAAYPDALHALSALKTTGLSTAILSNGSPDMLDAAVKSSGLQTKLDAVLSVEQVGVFKPHPDVYRMVETHFGCSPDHVLFCSSNGWDAAFAARFGFHTAWINRAGLPMDRLPGTPAHIVTDLSEIPALASNL